MGPVPNSLFLSQGGNGLESAMLQKLRWIQQCHKCDCCDAPNKTPDGMGWVKNLSSHDRHSHIFDLKENEVRGLLRQNLQKIGLILHRWEARLACWDVTMLVSVPCVALRQSSVRHWDKRGQPTLEPKRTTQKDKKGRIHAKGRTGVVRRCDSPLREPSLTTTSLCSWLPLSQCETPWAHHVTPPCRLTSKIHRDALRASRSAVTRDRHRGIERSAANGGRQSDRMKSLHTGRSKRVSRHIKHQSIAQTVRAPKNSVSSSSASTQPFFAGSLPSRSSMKETLTRSTKCFLIHVEIDKLVFPSQHLRMQWIAMSRCGSIRRHPSKARFFGAVTTETIRLMIHQHPSVSTVFWNKLCSAP